MVKIHNEIRSNDEGEAEVWVNLGDVLDWLGRLPPYSSSPIAAGAALEIREMLLNQFDAAAREYLGH